MNTHLLKFLDVFKGIYRMLGVDYTQLRAIVDIKLTMDNRRQTVSYRKKDHQDPANAFLWTMFFYTLFGGFIALGLYGIPSFILSMIIFFSYLMVMIAMTLITDFSSVLLDTSDNTIILPRPVGSRTVFVARITHILLYLGQITTGLAAVPALVVMLKYGLTTFLLFLVAIILSVITALTITNILYLLILRFANEDRLRNVINYFQIMMAVLIMGGYQLMPRLAERLDMQEYIFEIQWWSFLAPPVWMAAALNLYHAPVVDLSHVSLAVCAVIIPVAGFHLANKFLTPVFVKKLGTLGTESPTAAAPYPIGKTNPLMRISGWITTTRLEQAAFEFIFHILGRDRKLKLKIYPSFGYVIIFALIFIFRDQSDIMSAWKNLPNMPFQLLLVLYLTFMILQVAFHEMPYSDDFKASWVYFSTPLEKPGEILAGMLKAVMVRLFIPAYTIISIIVLILWREQALDDIVFAFFNNVLMVLIILLVNKRSLPLSIAPNASNRAGSFIRSIFMILLVGMLGFVHFLLAKDPVLLLAAIPVQLAVIYLLYTLYRRTSWTRLTL